MVVAGMVKFVSANLAEVNLNYPLVIGSILNGGLHPSLDQVIVTPKMILDDTVERGLSHLLLSQAIPTSTRVQEMISITIAIVHFPTGNLPLLIQETLLGAIVAGVVGVTDHIVGVPKMLHVHLPQINLRKRSRRRRKRLRLSEEVKHNLRITLILFPGRSKDSSVVGGVQQAQVMHRDVSYD